MERLTVIAMHPLPGRFTGTRPDRVRTFSPFHPSFGATPKEDWVLVAPLFTRERIAEAELTPFTFA
ncbi:hypothetical protein SNE510_76030 [Streptomyces sp. NE5-10]|nr:hypothetical protein SNE510_76030 [Streptomyces sp. NE5-10]